jgi:hypothetical protein
VLLGQLKIHHIFGWQSPASSFVQSLPRFELILHTVYNIAIAVAQNDYFKG